MENTYFERGFGFLHKVIEKLNELKSIKNITEISVVYFNCSDQSFLEKVLTYPFVKNLVNVGNFKLDKENVINISLEKWKENKEEFYERTKNSFVIEERGESVLGETYSILDEFSEFYPIILFFTSQKISKVRIQEKDYSAKVEEGSYLCCINKKITKNFFSSYTILEFEVLKKKLTFVKNIFRKEGEGREVYIDLKKEIKPVEDGQHHGIDFSFLEGIKTPKNDKKLDKYKIPKSRAWIQEFFEYLKDLLSRLIPKEKLGLINIILTNETLKTHWIPCFTHSTMNPNTGENYETYETIGDALQKYCFKMYVLNKEPFVTDERLTNLDQKYMSKDFQSHLSKKMKLQEWMIGLDSEDIRMDISEDLLEAFYGTIDHLLYQIKESVGLGAIVTYNLMKLLFDDYDFPGNSKGKTSSSDVSSGTIMPDKTFVQQAFKGKAFKTDTKKEKHYTPLTRPSVIPEDIWSKIVKNMNRTLEENEINPVKIRKDTNDHPGIVEEVKKLPDGKSRVTIKILESYVKLLRKYDIYLEGRGDIEIGDSIKNTQKSADKVAYQRAAEYLKTHGITIEWKNLINDIQQSSTLMNEDKALMKAKKKYPEIVEIKVHRTNPKIRKNIQGVITYQIQGITEEGKLIPVYTISSSDPGYEQGIIDEFLEDKKF